MNIKVKTEMNIALIDTETLKKCTMLYLLFSPHGRVEDIFLVIFYLRVGNLMLRSVQ